MILISGLITNEVSRVQSNLFPIWQSFSSFTNQNEWKQYMHKLNVCREISKTLTSILLISPWLDGRATTASNIEDGPCGNLAGTLAPCGWLDGRTPWLDTLRWWSASTLWVGWAWCCCCGCPRDELLECGTTTSGVLTVVGWGALACWLIMLVLTDCLCSSSSLAWKKKFESFNWLILLFQNKIYVRNWKKRRMYLECKCKTFGNAKMTVA